MKMTFKTMLALMAGAMVFTACNKDDIIENVNEQKTTQLKHMVFTATQEGQGGATRAAIDGTAINWTATDKISIFDGSTENKGNQEFTLTSEAGKTSGTFEGEAADGADVYYALYPYVASSSVERVPTLEEAQAAAGDMAAKNFGDWKMYIKISESIVMGEMEMYGISSDNQAIILAYLKNETRTFKSGPQRNASDQFENVSLPAVQTATAGSADPMAMLMMGQSEDASTIQFKNICAYVKVKPTFDCKRIVIKSNGPEPLAGTLTVDYNEGTPTTTVTANGTNAVTLSGTITANKIYYIAVRPEVLASGFTIVFTTADNRYKKSTSKEVTFARSHVTDLGSFATSNLTSIPTSGTAQTTIDGATVNVPWVQLWEDGPKFAGYNVGVTDGKAESRGGTYQFTEDVVSSRWGSIWRLPTKNEFEELIANCTCTRINDYESTGVKGLLCIGKEGSDYESNSMFLPITTESETANYGAYWTSDQATPSDNYYLDINFDGNFTTLTNNTTTASYSVRAVLNEE